MSDEWRSPQINERDPLDVVRSAAGSAGTRERNVRAELARMEILCEGISHSTSALPELREKHAEAARIRRRWARALQVMEAAALLGDLGDGE